MWPGWWRVWENADVMHGGVLLPQERMGQFLAGVVAGTVRPETLVGLMPILRIPVPDVFVPGSMAYLYTTSQAWATFVGRVKRGEFLELMPGG
ncbi:hypothetical protein DP939_42860 [Spongiactinospora rosea]|uniref:Uncharacterized protein n=2 Tax=Spongiactinospora rosea TaxID=2248750 RepID=A0A366LJI4_9ACTN|nr:hypothetical protein DP939_42860 [Spongiactinospora rosea]